MGHAIVDMLPYTIGLIVSPIPVVAVILLLVSRGGLPKATVFVVSWLLISFVLVVLLGRLAASAPQSDGGPPPTWESWFLLAIGAVMLALAALLLRQLVRQRHERRPAAPRWMSRLDAMAPGKVAIVAVVLIVANPVNLSMVLAAAIELGRERLPIARNIMPAAVFVLIGSVSVLVPYLGALLLGPGSGLLPRVRRWLLRYNTLLSFLTAAAFGVLFVAKALKGLL